MGWTHRYPHIPNLLSMKPTPRILLGQKLFWTEKKDGHCMAIWMNNGEIQISSRNLETATQELQSLVKRTEEYPKVLKLLEENPQFVIYVEACGEGRSKTGIEQYERAMLFIFDIYDTYTEKFLSYVNTHQHAFHYNIQIVKLYAETRHRSIRNLLKFRKEVLEYCASIKIEGMVIKAYRITERFQKWNTFKGGLIQAKVKLDIPDPPKRKITKGEPIYPTIPDVDVMGAIDKVWQELGTEKFRDVRIAMPLVAKAIGEECKNHFYSNPKRKLFSLYQEYLEKLV